MMMTSTTGAGGEGKHLPKGSSLLQHSSTNEVSGGPDVSRFEKAGISGNRAHRCPVAAYSGHVLKYNMQTGNVRA